MNEFGRLFFGRDGKKLDRPLRLRPPIMIGWYVDIAKGIVLNPSFHVFHLKMLMLNTVGTGFFFGKIFMPTLLLRQRFYPNSVIATTFIYGVK